MFEESYWWQSRVLSVEVAGSLGESTELKSQVLWKGISLKMYSWRIQFTGIWPLIYFNSMRWMFARQACIKERHFSHIKLLWLLYTFFGHLRHLTTADLFWVSFGLGRWCQYHCVQCTYSRIEGGCLANKLFVSLKIVSFWGERRNSTKNGHWAERHHVNEVNPTWRTLRLQIKSHFYGGAPRMLWGNESC